MDSQAALKAIEYSSINSDAVLRGITVLRNLHSATGIEAADELGKFQDRNNSYFGKLNLNLPLCKIVLPRSAEFGKSGTLYILSNMTM